MRHKTFIVIFLLQSSQLTVIGNVFCISLKTRNCMLINLKQRIACKDKKCCFVYCWCWSSDHPETASRNSWWRNFKLAAYTVHWLLQMAKQTAAIGTQWVSKKKKKPCKYETSGSYSYQQPATSSVKSSLAWLLVASSRTQQWRQPGGKWLAVYRVWVGVFFILKIISFCSHIHNCYNLLHAIR